MVRACGLQCKAKLKCSSRHTHKIRSCNDIRLMLAGCNVRESGAAALGKLLRSNRTLTYLGLEWNGVGMKEEGVEALSKVRRVLRCWAR